MLSDDRKWKAVLEARWGDGWVNLSVMQRDDGSDIPGDSLIVKYGHDRVVAVFDVVAEAYRHPMFAPWAKMIDSGALHLLTRGAASYSWSMGVLNANRS